MLPPTTARSRPSMTGRDPGAGGLGPHQGFRASSPPAAGTGCPVRGGGPDPGQEGTWGPPAVTSARGSGSVGWPSPPALGSEGLGWGSPGGRGTVEKPRVGRGSALGDFAEGLTPLSAPRSTSALPSLRGFTSNKPLIRPGMSPPGRGRSWVSLLRGTLRCHPGLG